MRITRSVCSATRTSRACDASAVQAAHVRAAPDAGLEELDRGVRAVRRRLVIEEEQQPAGDQHQERGERQPTEAEGVGHAEVLAAHHAREEVLHELLHHDISLARPRPMPSCWSRANCASARVAGPVRPARRTRSGCRGRDSTNPSMVAVTVQPEVRAGQVDGQHPVVRRAPPRTGRRAAPAPRSAGTSRSGTEITGLRVASPRRREEAPERSAAEQRQRQRPEDGATRSRIFFHRVRYLVRTRASSGSSSRIGPPGRSARFRPSARRCSRTSAAGRPSLSGR